MSEDMSDEYDRAGINVMKSLADKHSAEANLLNEQAAAMKGEEARQQQEHELRLQNYKEKKNADLGGSSTPH